jgi:hypothetical protein
MRQATILTMVLAAVGCVADDDDDEHDLSASEEAESTAAPTHDPTGPNCPGGSGGPEPSGGPGDQPERKRCLPSNPDEICLDCCWYNHYYVDGWKCRQIKHEKKRRACWERANETLAKCQREDCDRYGPITTIQVGDDVDR